MSVEWVDTDHISRLEPMVGLESLSLSRGVSPSSLLLILVITKANLVNLGESIHPDQ